MLADVIQTVLDGLMVGGLYIAVAVGITLIFGIMGILNFAHGTFLMLGAYVAYFSVTSGLSFGLALVFAMFATGVLSLVLERLVFRRVMDDHMGGLTASLGLIMVIESLSAAAFTPDHRSMDPPYPGSFELLGLTLPLQRVLVLLTAMALVAMLFIFLQKTRLGKAVRAMGQNRTGAALVGVQTAQVTTTVFLVGSALAGAVGALYATLFPISPYMASAPLMKGFIVTVLGGLGSVPGAVVAGCLLGLAESFGSRYLSASFRDGYGFILMIVCLLYFPTGLLSGRGKARV
jgi:branched-chain amino acid transport system permease protein